MRQKSTPKLSPTPDKKARRKRSRPRVRFDVLATVVVCFIPFVTATVIWFFAFPYSAPQKAVRSEDYRQVVEFNPVVFWGAIAGAIVLLIVCSIVVSRHMRNFDYSDILFPLLLMGCFVGGVVFLMLSSFLYPSFSNAGLTGTVENVKVVSSTQEATEEARFMDPDEGERVLYVSDLRLGAPVVKPTIMYEYYRPGRGL